MKLQELLDSVSSDIAIEFKTRMRLEYKRGYRNGANSVYKDLNIDANNLWKLKDYDRIRKQNVELNDKNKKMKNIVHELQVELAKYKPKHNYSLEG